MKLILTSYIVLFFVLPSLGQIGISESCMSKFEKGKLDYDGSEVVFIMHEDAPYTENELLQGLKELDFATKTYLVTKEMDIFSGYDISFGNGFTSNYASYNICMLDDFYENRYYVVYYEIGGYVLDTKTMTKTVFDTYCHHGTFSANKKFISATLKKVQSKF